MKKAFDIFKGPKSTPAVLGLLMGFVFFLALGLMALDEDQENRIIKVNQNNRFENGRIIQTKETVYKDKDDFYKKKHEKLEESQKVLIAELKELKSKLNSIESKPKNPHLLENKEAKPQKPIELAETNLKLTKPETPKKRQLVNNKLADKNKGFIVFPVKKTKKSKDFVGVDIPSGSYVKGTVIAGAQVTQGKTIPFLVQLDEVYIMPNNKWIDLSGCFVIAKGEADLSTERLEMQPNSISCVNSKNEMFEAQLTGWAVDEKDNNFALDAELISKRGRVASAAFLSSLVSGIGSAIKQAQTTQTQTPLGGNQTTLTGNQTKYVAAGAVSESASMVTQWYLEQARNLLPTLKVGSGRKIWLVMGKSLSIPVSFLRDMNNVKSENKIVFRDVR